MKSLVLSTSTNETTKYSDGLKRFGEVKLLAYDSLGHSESLMLSQCREYKPDVIVYIGSRWGQMPSMAALAQLNSSLAPMVHLCSDAADPPWWDLLQEYHYAGCFNLQVAIDGSKRWPLSDSQLTLLTPVDPENFPAWTPHVSRNVACGYAGNPGSGAGSKRTAILSGLLSARAIDLRIRSNLPFTYDAYCSYLSTCRLSLNIAYSGTESATQVKGRVVESALAGCCLLETEGSPTADWFTPGVDYITYDDAADALRLIRMLANEPEVTQKYADNLRAKIISEHTPDKFWQKIFNRIGVKVVV